MNRAVKSCHASRFFHFTLDQTEVWEVEYTSLTQWVKTAEMTKLWSNGAIWQGHRQKWPAASLHQLLFSHSDKQLKHRTWRSGAAWCPRFSHDCRLGTLTNEFPSGGQCAHQDYQIFCRTRPKQALDEFITMSKIVLVPENKKSSKRFSLLDEGFIEGWGKSMELYQHDNRCPWKPPKHWLHTQHQIGLFRAFKFETIYSCIKVSFRYTERKINSWK